MHPSRSRLWLPEPDVLLLLEPAKHIYVYKYISIVLCYYSGRARKPPTEGDVNITTGINILL